MEGKESRCKEWGGCRYSSLFCSILWTLHVFIIVWKETHRRGNKHDVGWNNMPRTQNCSGNPSVWHLHSHGRHGKHRFVHGQHALEGWVFMLRDHRKETASPCLYGYGSKLSFTCPHKSGTMGRIPNPSTEESNRLALMTWSSRVW